MVIYSIKLACYEKNRILIGEIVRIICYYRSCRACTLLVIFLSVNFTADVIPLNTSLIRLKIVCAFSGKLPDYVF